MADEEVTEKKGGGNGMMIVLIILVVALIGAVGFLGYMVMSKTDQTPGSEKAQEEKAKAEAQELKGGESFTAKIDNLVLNITNAKGREKLMKLSFTIKSVEPTIAALVESNNAEIVDAVIGQISARTSEELLTVGGKQLLKEEMLEEINAILNEATVSNEDIKRNHIKKLFFTSFVIK